MLDNSANANQDTRSILITGCSSGIGLCAAQVLAKEGYKVYATARKQADVDKLTAMGLTALQMDVTNYAQVDSVLDFIAQDNGTLYALFNNAGYSQIGAAEDLSSAAMKEQFDTNFFAPVEIGNRVIQRFMRPQGYGRIIQNTSVFGLASMAFRAAYCSSKYALEGFTDALRQEQNLFNTGIKVVLIEPGPIVSNIRQNKQFYFEKHILSMLEQSRFKAVYEHMNKGLAMSGRIPMTMEAEAVVDKLRLALTLDEPKPRYYVTRMTTVFVTLKRLLSHRAFDAFSARITKKETGQ